MFILQILTIFMILGCPDCPSIELCFVSIKNFNMRFNIFIISLLFFVNVFLKCDWLIFFFFKLVIPFKTLTWDTFSLFILHESKLSSFFFSWDQ